MEADHIELPRRGGIFISYRKADEPFGALWIDQVLSERFGAGQVFRDSRSMQPGTDFPPELWTALSRCAVMVVVIGRNWIPADWSGDFVRGEIHQALKLGIRIIPVLLGEAHMPSAASLPEDIRALATRQYVRLPGARDADHIERLVKAIKPRPWRAGLPIATSLLASATSIVIEFATDLRFNFGVWVVTGILIAASALLNGVVSAGRPRWLGGGPVTGWGPILRFTLAGSVVLVLIAIYALVQSPAKSCLTSKRTFDFEGEGTDGWSIRYENDVKLGQSFDQRGTSARSDEFGTEFVFDLNPQPPLDKGQIKVEGVPFRSELSGWVLVPKENPLPIQVSGLVLEHVQDHYSYHWTAPVSVQPGQWTQVSFHPADFIHVNTNPSSPFSRTEWDNPPLLAGFEFRSAETNSTAVRSRVHLDDVSVC